MLTVEFETESKNGSIEIPEKYRGQLKGKLQVVISVKEAEKVEEEPYDILTELVENPLKSEGFKPLTRDEIYDREEDRAENYIKFLMKNPLKVDRSIPFLTRDEIYDRKL
ncbi:MAG TPA: hypothetical protein VNI84_07630 [Pyrinomonadaceae bacterium]|nr:hypothetical protein [Pyrinomonadaceae bacterium]